MKNLRPFFVTAAVEGTIDEAALRILLVHCGLNPGPIYSGFGKNYIRQRIKAYNQAARHSTWVVLIDLNHEAECAPALRRNWLLSPNPLMNMRVAVRGIESWLLGDQERIASFLGVPLSKIPQKPDSIHNPKKTMVELAARSRVRNIREDMVPRPGSGRIVGPLYTARVIEFISDRSVGWRPEIAARNSASLNRCLLCLKRLES